MFKLCSLSVTMFLFLISSAAMGNFTVTNSYFLADAQVYSNLYGPGTSHNEGFSPVDAYTAVGGQEGGSAAQATANFLNVSSWSAVDSAPGHIGSAVSSAGYVMMEIITDEPWQLNIQTTYSLNFSTNASSGVTAKANVTDLGNNPIYSYDVTIDGLYGGAIIGPGSYNLALYATSYAILPEVSDVYGFANSTVGINTSISAVPEPGTALLFFVGAGLLHRLRNRTTRHC